MKLGVSISLFFDFKRSKCNLRSIFGEFILWKMSDLVGYLQFQISTFKLSVNIVKNPHNSPINTRVGQ